MKHFLGFLIFAASLSATDWRLSNPLQLAAGGRPWWCQSNCTASREILFDAPTGPGGCFQIWSMAKDGSSQVNISGTLMTGSTSKNHGNATYSPDGAFMFLMEQSDSSSLACSVLETTPGRGVDNELWVCLTSTWACAKLIARPIDGLHGVGKPRLSRDGKTLLYFNLQGVGVHGGLGGQLGICTWNSVAHSADNCVAQDPITPNNYYEVHDTDPNELVNCTVWFQSSTGASNQFSEYKYNWCTQAPALQLTPTNDFSEFWGLTNRGNLAVYSSSEFTPFPVPPQLINTLEVTLADAQTGANKIPLTCFNTPGTQDYDATLGVIAISQTVFSPDGRQILVPKTVVKTGNTVIWRYDFTPTSVAP